MIKPQNRRPDGKSCLIFGESAMAALGMPEFVTLMGPLHA
jgi:hypothetical protein